MTPLTYRVGRMNYTPQQFISILLFFPMLLSSLVSSVGQGAINFFSSGLR